MTKNTYIQLGIIIFSVLLFIPFIGNVPLFDWDEINFAESAREMIVSGDYLNVQINFEQFWEKPPLFIWLQVVSMKIFGINEFAARFPNAVAGIVTLLFLFNIGRKYFSQSFGLLWVAVYAGSFLPHLYFKSGIIDPWFNLFIFSSIFFSVHYLSSKERKYKFLILSGFLLGLAVLTKGPVAILLFGTTLFFLFLIKKFKIKLTIKELILFILVSSFVGGFWFILQIIEGNYTVIQDFIVYQIRLFRTEDAGHGGFLGYHFVVLFLGVFPASIFSFKYIKNSYSDKNEQKMFRQACVILFWAVLIIFTIVKTKIVHYSSLAYFPLTFIAVYSIQKTISGEYLKSKIVSILLIFFSFIFGISVIAVQYISMNWENLKNKIEIKDDFFLANMQAKPEWSGFEMFIGFFLILAIPAVLWFFRNNYKLKIYSVFLVSGIFINSTLIFTVPKIEKYTQNAAIEFFIKHSEEDAQIKTFGYKSYAHLFYGKKQKKLLNISSVNTENQKKITYFVCKINKEKSFVEKHPKAEKLYDKNGFCFYILKNAGDE